MPMLTFSRGRAATLLVSTLVSGSIACGATSAPPTPRAPTAAPIASASAPVEPPPPIAIAAPEIAAAPAECAALAVSESVKGAEASACTTGVQALARVAAGLRGDAAARAQALFDADRCEVLPPIVADVVRATDAPIVCAETIVGAALDARGKEAFPPHLAAARALVGASRLSRLRPKKGAFDLLARADIDAAAGDAGVREVVAWRDAVEKQEREALTLASGAPAEVIAIVHFEAAAAWIALGKELRSTPLPEEVRALSTRDKDLETRYLAKLDEATTPLFERARQLALAGLGAGVRDGVLVQSLPSFVALVAAFKSSPGFEARTRRDLALLESIDLEAMKPPKGASPTADADTIAATLPPWAAFAILERAEPASLLAPSVLSSMAAWRGIPAALRLEIERDKKLDDAHRAPIVLARLRTALAYGSRPDAEAVAAWKTPKRPVDRLRVAIARALLGPTAPPPKLGDPSATAPSSGYDLAPLDRIAKDTGAIADAAAFDAALLSLDDAKGVSDSDPKAPYAAAIARLDAVAARKGADASLVDRAKSLAQDARASLNLLDSKGAPKP